MKKLTIPASIAVAGILAGPLTAYAQTGGNTGSGGSTLCGTESGEDDKGCVIGALTGAALLGGGAILLVEDDDDDEGADSDGEGVDSGGEGETPGEPVSPGGN